jgi:hypothetical protein
MQVRDRRVLAAVELTALFAPPLALAIAAGDGLRGLSGAALALASLAAGAAAWAAVTFGLERKLRGSAASGRATPRGLAIGAITGVAALLIALLLIRSGSVLAPLLVGIYACTLVMSVLRDRRVRVMSAGAPVVRNPVNAILETSERGPG